VLPARRQDWSPGIAAVLSLAIPGAGQMYKGRLGAGFGWLVGTALGYLCFILPGIVLHILSILNAYSGDPGRRGG
jgi:TM2 domain-containing membrane protein YozV